MSFIVRKTDDIQAVMALHMLCMPVDDFKVDKHDAWLVYDERGAECGWATAKFNKKLNYVFLSSAGVLPYAQGKGLQKRLIRARVNWARKIGAECVYTYTVLKNYPSMINLLKCGFKPYEPVGAWKYQGDDVHYFKLELKQ